MYRMKLFQILLVFSLVVPQSLDAFTLNETEETIHEKGTPRKLLQKASDESTLGFEIAFFVSLAGFISGSSCLYYGARCTKDRFDSAHYKGCGSAVAGFTFITMVVSGLCWYISDWAVRKNRGE